MSRQITNDRFLKALNRQPVDKTPVWLMRQAGRYLPEYRALRAKAPNFMDFCANPNMACEATMQPLARYDLDAAILFSDILTIPDAMGLGLNFVPGSGPHFERPVQTLKDIKKLASPDMVDLQYVFDAVGQILSQDDMTVPLIGFAGSPWTIASYMVEGKPSKTFSIIKAMAYREPQALHHLLEILSAAITDYLNAQIEAGVDAVMIFDTWGGVLTGPAYQEFSLQYMQKIMAGLTKTVPVIMFTKNSTQWLGDLSKSGCDALGVDWTIDLAKARELTGGSVALQGNMDPHVLYGSPDSIRAEVARIMQSADGMPGHVFNFGHGMLPDMDPEHVGILIDAVHEYKHERRA